MPWAFWNVEEDDEPTWQKPTEKEERGFFNLTDNCETVNASDANNDSDNSDDSDD